MNYIDTRKYNYILLDADNTLFDFDLSEKNALAATFGEFGIDISEEQNEVYHKINDALWKKLERGETTREKLKIQRFAEFSDFLGVNSVSPEELAEHYVENLSNQNILIDGALALCEQLAEEYTLGIITNGITYIQEKRFRNSRLKYSVEFLFVSETLGYNKPDVEFFNKVTQIIGEFDPRKYLVIGDSLTSDIQGAVNFGCDSVWIAPVGASDDRPTYTVNKLDEIFDILLD